MKLRSMKFAAVGLLAMNLCGCGPKAGTTVPEPNAPSPASMNDLPPAEQEALKKQIEAEMSQ